MSQTKGLLIVLSIVVLGAIGIVRSAVAGVDTGPVNVIYLDSFYVTQSHWTHKPLMFSERQIRTRLRYGNFRTKREEVVYFLHHNWALTSCRLERRVYIPFAELAVTSLGDEWALVAFPGGLRPVARDEVTVKMYPDFVARQMARVDKTPPDYWAYQWEPGTHYYDGRLLHVVWQ